MSKKGYYNCDENIFDDEEDDDDEFDNQEFLQEVPYSSSSLDRSSIGSIPWADDAIKQNQLAWERVERMLTGEEPLPDEQELRQEIVEWQRKFPKIFGKSAERDASNSALHATTSKSFDKDTILNLGLNSLDDDDDDDDNDELATPTLKPRPNISSASNQRIPPETPPSARAPTIGNLSDLLERGLRITSVPLALRQRQRHAPHKPLQHIVLTPAPSTPSSSQKASALHVTATPSAGPNEPKKHHNKLHMPPILNVLEGRRRFLGRPSANRSFVQLTHVPQVQSAAVTYQPKKRLAGVPGGGGVVGTANGNKSGWQTPLTAATLKSRFANNRNAIVLPSLQPRTQQQSQQIHLRDSGSHRAISSVHSSYHNSMGSADVTNAITHGWQPQPYKYVAQWNFNGAAPMVVSSTTPSTSGRSISAAVHPHHQTRTQFSRAFFLPYAATKFK